MTWETVSAIAELIAAIAVVVSLWYLAVQLKQSNELAKAELEVQLGVTWAEMHDNMIQNPGLAKAYDLAENNWSKMSDEDVRAYLWFVAKSFHDPGGNVPTISARSPCEGRVGTVRAIHSGCTSDRRS